MLRESQPAESLPGILSGQDSEDAVAGPYKEEIRDIIPNDTDQNRISPAELRKYEGFESISDADAEKEIDNLVKFARILYHHFNRKSS